jgi:ATP-dependent helicase/nuclease subunit B
MPRMAVVGDLDLDETLGPLLDSWCRRSMCRLPPIPPALAAAGRPAARSPGRWGARRQRPAAPRLPDGPDDGPAAGRGCRPGALWERVLDLLATWRGTGMTACRCSWWCRRLAGELRARGAGRCRHPPQHAVPRSRAALARARPPRRSWRLASPAPRPAGRLLRVVADLPNGAVILPDLDLSLDAEVWDELGPPARPDEGSAVRPAMTRDPPAVPPQAAAQPHGRGAGRGAAWHRAGLARARRAQPRDLQPVPAAAGEQGWAKLPPRKAPAGGCAADRERPPGGGGTGHRPAGARGTGAAGKRVAVVTPDRGLAGRVVQHLKRWNIEADDTAGRPLAQTAPGVCCCCWPKYWRKGRAGAADGAAGASAGAAWDGREAWLKAVRALEWRCVARVLPPDRNRCAVAGGNKGHRWPWWSEGRGRSYRRCWTCPNARCWPMR